MMDLRRLIRQTITNGLWPLRRTRFRASISSAARTESIVTRRISRTTRSRTAVRSVETQAPSTFHSFLIRRILLLCFWVHAGFGGGQARAAAFPCSVRILKPAEAEHAAAVKQIWSARLPLAELRTLTASRR